MTEPERRSDRRKTLFSKTITDLWDAPFVSGEVLRRDASFAVAVDPSLDDDCRVMVVKRSDGAVSAAVTPELADALGMAHEPPVSELDLRRKLSEASVTLHGADLLFYFSERERSRLLGEEPRDGVRRLTEDDRPLFSAFEASASERDRDDADVDLDHLAAFGSFEQGRLVCVASMYQWDDTPVADLGC